MNATLQKKICMLGAFSVGKTSLVKRFIQSVFSEAISPRLASKSTRRPWSCRIGP